MKTEELPSPEAFAMLFQRNPQPMWIFAPDTLAFLAVNDAAVTHYGYSRKEFLDMTLRDIRPAEAGDQQMLTDKLADPSPTTFCADRHYRHRRKDGSLIVVELTAYALEFAGKPARLVLVYDITARTRDDEVLRRERAFVDSLLDAMPDALMACDAQGELTYLNRAVRKRLSLPAGRIDLAELRRHFTLFEANGTTPLPLERSPLTRAYSGESVRDAEMAMLLTTGELRHLLVNARPIPGPDGGSDGAVAIIHDVTTFRQAQTELREREQMLATLTANLPGVVYRCSNAPQWPLEFVSEGCLELTGHSAPDLVAGRTSFIEMTHPDDWEQVLTGIEVSLREHRPYQLNYRIHTRTGEEKWVWEQGSGVYGEDGALLFLEGFITDISARKHAELALAASEARYRQLFEHAVEGVFRTTLDGHFLIANPSCARILGYPDAQTLLDPSRPVADNLYLDPQDRGRLLETLRTEGSVRNHALQLRRPDGEIIWVNENIRALHDADGRMSGMEGTIEDITAQVNADRAMRVSEERFERATNGANDGLWDWNLQTAQMYYSPRWKAQLGYAPDELDSTIDSWLNRIHADDRRAVEVALEAHRAGRTTHYEVEHRVRHKDGHYRWMLARGTSSRSRVDGTEHIAGSQTDITERKRGEQRLQHDALHDGLTDLPNRTLLLDRLDQVLRRHRREPGTQFALLYLDLDRFKLVNDSLGHAAGDELLIEIARRWRSHVREYDTLARLGGDEFVLLLENLHGHEQAIAKADALLAVLHAPVRLAGQDIVVGSSIGIVFSDVADREAGAQDLLRDADNAMYRAKTTGRNRIVVFDPSMHDSVLRTFELENDLRAALGTAQLRLHYQPILQLDDHSVCGYEALLRWTHPVNGPVAPMDFIPMAEETGIIIELDMWVVDEACRQMAAWRASGQVGATATIAVNLSAKQLAQRQLPARIEAILREHGLPGGVLKLEITETAIIENLDTAGELFTQLQQLGVGVVLDDFGTGYSSLSHLYRFPFDGIKVDQSFVRQINSTRNANHIMELIRLLGEKMCISVVPEGIETEAQLDYLKQLGFLQAQGFLLGRPQPPETALPPAADPPAR